MAENLKQIIEFQAKGIQKLKGQYKDLERRTKGLEGSTGRASGAMGGMIAKLGLTTVALYATARAMSGVVRVGKDFEKNMSNVAAISGATGQELKDLEENAKQLGSTTVFTASQVAELQVEFAKLGFSSKQIKGVTKDTLALASATGAELSTAAAVAGQTLRAFGLEVGETSRVTDTMALSFSSSALDMDKFTNSMQYVAPIAKQVGFTVEDTTAILGTLANAGISGSMAGTSLRKILLELGNENSKLSKKIGFSVKSSEDLERALVKLNSEGIGTAEMKELVGQRAISAFNILMEGTKTTSELAVALRDSGGAAQEMADIQLDNLEGKMTLLNSAMEGLGITLFDHLSVPLSNAVVAFTRFIGTVNDFLAIPISQKLMDEQAEFNNLIEVLNKSNTAQTTRNDIIKRLQKDYPDYIKNLDLEKASIEEIKKAQHEANIEFGEKIRLQAAEEVLMDARKNAVRIAKDLTVAQLALNEEEGKELKFNRTKEGFLVANTINLDKKRRAVRRLQEEQEKEIANLQLLEENLKKLNPVQVDSTDGTKEKTKEVQLGVLAQYSLNNAVQESLDKELAITPVTAELSEKFIDLNAKVDAGKYTWQAFKQNLDQASASAIFSAGSITSTSDAMGAASQAAKKASISFIQAEIQKAVASYVTSQISSAGALGWLVAPLAMAGGAAFGSLMGSAIQRIEFAEKGFDGVVNQPTMFMTGESNKAEHVSITPLESPNISGGKGGGTININISAMTADEAVIDTIIPALERAKALNLA